MTHFSFSLPRVAAVGLVCGAAFSAMATPASALPFRSDAAVGQAAALPLEQVQWRGRGYGGPRYGYYRRGSSRGAVVGGLAVLGALGVAAAVAAQQPAYGYAPEPAYGYAPAPAYGYVPAAPAYGYAPVDGYGNTVIYNEAPAYGYAPAPVYGYPPAYGYAPGPYRQRYSGYRSGNRPGGGVDPARGSMR
jgi:hypothetical protein